MLDAEPVAELGIVGRGAVDADHADRPGVVLDQEHGLAAERGGGADEFDGVILRIGVRKATGVFRDTAVVGEVGDGPDVGESRAPQRQPLGGDDARSRLPQGHAREILQHVRLRQSH
ncbi:hypothetical protein ABIF75_006323 [Bradyrhizobium japonicum]